MVQVTYDDGACLLTLFRIFGIGYTKVNAEDEKSITFTINIGKVHTFFTLAWI